MEECIIIIIFTLLVTEMFLVKFYIKFLWHLIVQITVILY